MWQLSSSFSKAPLPSRPRLAPLLERVHSMTKKIERLSDYITAEEAAQYLSARLGRTVPPVYIDKLTHRKKNPVRIQTMGNRFLYNRADIENTTIREISDQTDTPE